MRVEPGPGIDLAPLQRDSPIGVLQVDDLDVGLGEPGFIQRAQQEEVGIGALGGRDLLPLQVGDRGDGRVGRDDQRRPLRLGVDVDGLDRRAIGARQEGRGPGGRTEVDRLGAQVLVRLVAAGAEHPLDPDTLLLQRLLQPAEAAQHQAARVVVGVVEAHRRRLLLRATPRPAFAPAPG